MVEFRPSESLESRLVSEVPQFAAILSRHIGKILQILCNISRSEVQIRLVHLGNSEKYRFKFGFNISSVQAYENVEDLAVNTIYEFILEIFSEINDPKDCKNKELVVEKFLNLLNKIVKIEIDCESVELIKNHVFVIQKEIRKYKNLNPQLFRLWGKTAANSLSAANSGNDGEFDKKDITTVNEGAKGGQLDLFNPSQDSSIDSASGNEGEVLKLKPFAKVSRRTGQATFGLNDAASGRHFPMLIKGELAAKLCAMINDSLDPANEVDVLVRYTESGQAVGVDVIGPEG